jgi:hypothetical protein
MHNSEGKMTIQELRIKLLELEVQALRSVLSEFEGDKTEYLQMSTADAIERVLEVLPR